MKLFVIIGAGFGVIDQLLMKFSAFARYWRRNGSTMRPYIIYSLTEESALFNEEESNV
jgi:hypothetical protein